MPYRTPITDHTAEVLRQVEGARMREDSQVRGDSQFGSLYSLIKLRKRLRVYSVFIIKTNKSFFPMKVLSRILLARYRSRPARH